MAVLSDTLRAKIWRELMARAEFPGTIVKADLRAAVNAVDDWIDQNGAVLNAALPQPFRGAATARQKALLLALACLERAGVA